MLDDTIPLTSEQKKRIGAQIKQIRISKNYTVEQLAAMIRMPSESLQRMEDGDFELYDDTLAKIDGLLS